MEPRPQLPGQPNGPGTPSGPPVGPPPGPGSVPGATWGSAAGPAWSSPAVPPPPGPEAGPMPPAAPPRKRGRLGLLLAALGAGAGIIAVKVVSGLLVGSVVGSALGAFFGGPYQRLPSEVRNQFEQRVKTAVGSQLDGMSQATAADRLRTLVQRGLVRLDDATLVRHLTLQTQALDHGDSASCAGFARASIGGKPASADVSRGLMAALDDRSLQEFLDINIMGLEAEARAAPAARTVTDAQAQALFETLAGRLVEQDIVAIQALVAGTTTTDESACHAVRSLYDTALTMTPADVAVLARYDIQP
jgi:hypothetical protein